MKIPFAQRVSIWRPDWTWSRGVAVWRMRLSGGGHILLELRDHDARRAWFACLDERSGATLWEDLQLSEPWWVGVEDMEAGRMYLHGFRKPDMPQHVGIWAYDLDSGESLWKNEDLAFFLARGDTVYAMREQFEGLHFFSLDARDGSVTGQLGTDSSALSALREEMNTEDRYREYEYPESASAGSLPAELQAACAALSRTAVDGGFDLLLSGRVLLAAWHEQSGDDLEQFVGAVQPHDGAVLLRQRINSGLPAVNMDSFFVKSGTMFFIRDGHELNAFHLEGRTA
jgi:hypothetical protein